MENLTADIPLDQCLFMPLSNIVPTTSQPDHGWDESISPSDASSVTVKKYSFFQSEDEKAVAVIGESAAASDQDGSYRGPYAILTKQHFYCKNEDGTFIAKASDVLGTSSNQIKKFTWAFWVAAIIGIFVGAVPFLNIFAEILWDMGEPLPLVDALFEIWMGCCAVAAIHFYRRNDLKKATVALAFTILNTGCFIFTAIHLYQVWKNRTTPNLFNVHCVGRIFSFVMDNYPQQELQDFQNQVSLLTGQADKSIHKSINGPANRSYQAYQAPNQSSGRKRSPIVTIAAVVVILAVVIFAGAFVFKALTTCRVSGCENEVYQDGYCFEHYARNQASEVAGGLFDSIFG